VVSDLQRSWNVDQPEMPIERPQVDRPSSWKARESAAARYRPRRPNPSVLYRCIQEHLETWLAQCRDGYDDAGPVLPYVEREFRR
jgi:hypothetical protein